MTAPETEPGEAGSAGEGGPAARRDAIGAGCAKATPRWRAVSPRSACSAGSSSMPMLIGVFVGRWLDRTFNSGLFWTAPLLMLGLALGCWSAWKWMKSA